MTLRRRLRAGGGRLGDESTVAFLFRIAKLVKPTQQDVLSERPGADLDASHTQPRIAECAATAPAKCTDSPVPQRERRSRPVGFGGGMGPRHQVQAGFMGKSPFVRKPLAKWRTPASGGESQPQRQNLPDDRQPRGLIVVSKREGAVRSREG